MSYAIKYIASLLHAVNTVHATTEIVYLLLDSRKIVFPQSSLFFAITGDRRDGHSFIKEVYDRGVRNFVVQKDHPLIDFPDAVFLQVTDVLKALQILASKHRSAFSIPVIGITGSNGKTIVKEWLYQLLQADLPIVRSPRSFNSQIGVPLSVWQLNQTHQLAIFEAGISEPGEMDALADIIQPTIGVFTNLGDAHNKGFTDLRQKAIEKAKLFKHAEVLVFCKDNFQDVFFPDTLDAAFFPARISFFSWSRNQPATLKILAEIVQEKQTIISAIYQSDTIQIALPFTDKASIDNAITCWCVLLQMQYAPAKIAERILQLERVDMRMQLKKAINNCYVLNDSYSNDLSSLETAMDYLLQQAGKQPAVLILSDLMQSGIEEAALYQLIATMLKQRGLQRFIGIGSAITQQQQQFRQLGANVSFYPDTESFLQQASTHEFKDAYILLKGARVFAFERISHWLEQKVHQTVLEINLTAMLHNLKEYQKQLKPQTKLMAMVKAFSYGSGSAEVARILQFHKVDYLAVAYADEGIELRKAGISLPIMVMSPDVASFDALVNYDLEPEIYSFPIYQAFHAYLLQQAIQTFPVHIKFNTGMNRLGFEIEEAASLAKLLLTNQTMAVKTVFSHLVSSENAAQDGFSKKQVQSFQSASNTLERILQYPILKHLANSAAIFRNPDFQFDMVRLGIGLYGVAIADSKDLLLETVSVLKTTIAQIRKVPAGESVGYGRAGVVAQDSLIATVRIGYADGYDRRLGNGKGYMWLKGKQAAVVGQVCMDMSMIDITGIENVQEGDEVEVFGRHVTVQALAAIANTIPYEIMTGVSERVKRVYMEE